MKKVIFYESSLHNSNKKKSKRVKGKNFKKINGKPLFRFLLDKLLKSNFDEIYIDSDSNIIKKDIVNPKDTNLLIDYHLFQKIMLMEMIY